MVKGQSLLSSDDEWKDQLSFAILKNTQFYLQFIICSGPHSSPFTKTSQLPGENFKSGIMQKIILFIEPSAGLYDKSYII